MEVYIHSAHCLRRFILFLRVDICYRRREVYIFTEKVQTLNIKFPYRRSLHTECELSIIWRVNSLLNRLFSYYSQIRLPSQFIHQWSCSNYLSGPRWLTMQCNAMARWHWVCRMANHNHGVCQYASAPMLDWLISQYTSMQNNHSAW